MVQILIVDDDFAIQRLLQRILTGSGYSVSVASNGEEGLDKAKEICPALIICDWLMPNLSGLEVCSQIKKLPQLSTTFFILLTSLASIEDRVAGLDAGADDFLFKPVQVAELLARVRAGLRLHDLSQALKEKTELLEAELREAAEYIRSILPQSLVHKALSIDVRFIPSRQLGGDGFDYFWLDEENIAFYLLDVAGHGFKAAVPSIYVIDSLRKRQGDQVNYYSPQAVLNELNQNQVFQMTARNNSYFTIWYGVYNCRTQKLTYSSAGHPPGILLRTIEDGQIEETRLKTNGFPIGMFLESEYYEEIVPISTPASLYIFSDGIYEVEKDSHNFFCLEDFLVILKQYYLMPKENLDKLLLLLNQFYQKAIFEDDLSIIEINFH